jgi:hypothetical protein
MKLTSLSTVGDGVSVLPSSIPDSGLGLFAGRKFSRGEYITLYEGDSLTRKEAWSKEVLSHMASREGVFVDGLKEPVPGRGGGSFSNSAEREKDANASLVAWLGLLLLRAKRDISSGEEILLYYGRRGLRISCEN